MKETGCRQLYGPAEGIERVIRGDCRDPFSILGMRQENGKLVVRALLPGADSVSVVEAPSGRVLAHDVTVGGHGPVRY